MSIPFFLYLSGAYHLSSLYHASEANQIRSPNINIMMLQKIHVLSSIFISLNEKHFSNKELYIEQLVNKNEHIFNDMVQQ